MTAMLSVRDVATRLGIRPAGVTTLIHTGELRAHDVSLRPGGRPRWRIEAAELDSFLERRAHAAAPKRKRRRPQRGVVKKYF